MRPSEFPMPELEAVRMLAGWRNRGYTDVGPVFPSERWFKAYYRAAAELVDEYRRRKNLRLTLDLAERYWMVEQEVSGIVDGPPPSARDRTLSRGRPKKCYFQYVDGYRSFIAQRFPQ